MRATDRERFWAWFNDPDTPMPGGESMRGAGRRVLPRLHAVLGEMAAAADARALLVVAHGGVGRLIAADLLGIPLETARRMRLDNASISRMEPFLGGWALRLWNGTAHLSGLPPDEEGPTASRVG